MKKKVLYSMYIVCMLVMCLIPTIFTLVHKEENQREGNIETPKIKAGGKMNIHYLEDMDDYFSKTFAFRNELIAADAQLMKSVFGESNNDKIIVGKEGWLFFAETLDDYKGIPTITKRGANNIARTIELIQKVMEDSGSDFVFTIAPNKNSLYGQYMPNNIEKLSDRKNYDLVKEAMENYDINYFDLFQFIGSKDDVLYCKTDSHWNNKGAALAATELLKELGKECIDYNSMTPKKKFDYTGDLQEMLFPETTKPSEDNFYFGNEKELNITSPMKDVEAISVTTENPDKEGKIMMFRDSFGNAIIPYIADEYYQCSFSKAMPYNLTIAQLKGVDDVVIEIVERHLDLLCNEVPILMMPQNTEIDIENPIGDLKADVHIEEQEEQYLITGTIEEKFVSENSLVYVIINDRVYEAFPCSNNGEYNDNAFGLYIEKTEDIRDIRIAIQTNDKFHITKNKKNK